MKDEVLACAFALAAGGAAAACEAPESRQFDFWLGEWQVTAANGKHAGTNRIVREYGGCVIHERYTTPRGYAGESLNAWDADRKVWHQTWVDSSGTLLLLEGGLAGASMVLRGPGIDEGRPVKHRITWTPNADGSVRQHWETAAEDGQWKTTFDGTYRKNPDDRQR
jgi:hypothetical protein